MGVASHTATRAPGGWETPDRERRSRILGHPLPEAQIRAVRRASLAAIALTVFGCSRSSSGVASPSVSGACVTGSATYYADSLAGRPTASGEPYDPRALTAAAREVPLGTWVRVVWGERAVTVRVNDRGPFRRDGVIDLSRAAAESLGMIRRGRVPVRVCAL